jgi:hypothetical protein
VRDAFQAWKEGIPAVVLVHEPFATLTKAQCQSLGVSDPTILVYKQDAPARESEEDSMEKARQVSEQIVALLGGPG